VITYVPINLSNRRFYIGSTVNFAPRWKDHLNKKSNYPFQNALQKNPENFFVLISEDDGLETREEEQFYLDFYHGSGQCYNISSDATAPMSGRTHTKEAIEKFRRDHTEEWKREHSERMKGKGNPNYGKEFSDETIERQREAKRGEKNPCYGKRWWVKPSGETIYQTDCPGPEWQSGRKWRKQ
jgi:group I intron endonuclease